MTKQATSIRLSAEAEQNIKTIREKYTHLTDKTAAIEFAVWLAARSKISMAYLDESGLALKLNKAPAARPARAAKKEQER